MTKRSLWKWKYSLPEELSKIKIGQTVLVKDGHPLSGQFLTITRVDNHAYPICAGYTRFTLDQITLIEEGEKK